VLLVPTVEDLRTGDADPVAEIPVTGVKESAPASDDTSLTSGPKVPTTMNLNVRLLAEVKRAILVGAAQDFGPGSLSGFVEDAIRSQLEQYSKELNGGKRFSPYTGEMKRGRPAK